MRATTHIFWGMVVVTLLIIGCQSTSTCHVLCNCTNSICNSCYNNFQSNSSQTVAAAGTCPCPTGFYSFNSTCLFCQDNCKACTDTTTCLECFPGYTKINGTCVNNKYAQDVTWVLYECQKDLKTDSSGTPSIFGYNLFPVDPTVSSFFLSCPLISNQKLLGLKSTGNLTLSLLRTYHGLPYHQWAHISINYAVLDTWNNQTLQTELYLDAKLTNKTYKNTLRNTNLCGGAEPDSVDQMHSLISHDKPSLAINFTIPPNVTLAIKSIKIDVGTCARNCLSCSSPTNCLVCKSYYINVNGICQCNTSLSYPVTYGCLQNCRPGNFFVPGLERCTLCSLFIPNCFNCINSSICTQCNQNTFLFDNKCVLECPSPYFPKKTPDSTSGVPHCHPCPANCTQCFNETICLQCQSNFYVYSGNCVANCPPNHSIVSGRCYPQTMCGTGCQNCNRSVCIQCQVGFWLSGTNCLYDCPQGTYRSQNKTCLPCLTNCSSCLDTETCQTCSPSFTLRNGTCQYYTTTCNKVGYYFDPRVRYCVACQPGCVSCYRTLCYACGEGFFLDNGACQVSCSAQKYKINDNITTNNLCYWKNQICLDQASTTENSCTKCRSLDYIVALTPDFTCKTYCQANKTFSPHSYTLTQNSRICNVSCGANCEICINSAVCVKCVTGYVISAVTTTTCVTSCGNGFLSDSVQCLRCQYGCNTCDMNGNCLSWSLTPTNTSCSSNCTRCIGSNCVACSSGFYLNQLGTCQTSCAIGTFMDSVSGQCRKCQPQCQQCTAFSSCSKCVNGFYLWGQSCLRECPSGTYPNQEMLRCDSCAWNCKTCYGPKSYQCLSCYLGYSKQHSECVVACPVHKYEDVYGSCDWCHQSCRYCFGPAEFQCLECGLVNYLYKGECYNQTCPAATYLAVPATRQCKDCSRGCSLCTSPSSCQQCFPGFYPFNGECLDVCPTNTYYSWQSKTCVPCSSNCASCVSSSSCYQCLQTHYLYNGTCISSCPNGTFVLDYYYGQQCRACPFHCLTCLTSYQCTTCTDGLIMRNGLCTRYCQVGQYFNAVSDSCNACSANCTSCTSWGCTECQVGYYQYNGGCIQTCPAATYSVPQTAECGRCPSSCLSCATFYQCTSCRTNYTLVNGVCRRNDTCSTNCLQCADASICIVCRPGYFRFTNSTGVYCSATCPTRYYLYAGSQCIICQPQCLACADGIGCTQCQTGLILFMGQCLVECYPGFYPILVNSTVMCQPCSPLCQTCAFQANNCTICWSPTAVVENGTCVERRQCLLSSFFSESIGYCVPCTAHCRICHNPTQCDECLQGFFMTEDKLCQRECQNGEFLSSSTENPSASQCRSCPFPCLNCLTSTQCSNCYAGYPLNTTSGQCQTNCDRQTGYFLNILTNTCQRCNQRCLDCAGTSTSCTQCVAGYYLIGNECVIQCPEGTFPVVTARTCLPCGQNCQACTSQANCQRCLANTVNFNGSCLLICPAGYYNANGVCLPCVFPCRQCNGGSTYECATCQQGYYFFNNRCIQTCPEGYFRYPPSSSCRACPTACRNCTSFTSCQACQVNYTLNTVTEQCETLPVCPSSLPNCQSCRNNLSTNTTECAYCYNGFYLREGQCVPECNATYFENRLTGRCQPCQQNCLNCIDANSCIQCGNGFYLFNERCYQVCPNGTFPYVDNSTQNFPLNICRIDPCIHYVTVNSIQVCLICVSPFILYNGQCLEVCPIGTYRSELSCHQCRTGCTQCTDLLHCTNCSTNYHFYDFQCVQNCPAGTYPYVRPNRTNADNRIQDGQCLSCPGSCLTCTTQNRCTLCSAGYYLTANGQCVTQCPTGSYANFLTGNCEPCSPRCADCPSLDNCRRCETGSYLIAGQCTTDCPLGTYPVSGQCQPCLQYCRVCNISSNCTQCQPGYMLNRITNQCVQTCPGGTYVTVLEECLPCPAKCATCSSSSECITCSATAILFNGDCINQCPSGYTLSVVSRMCIECDSYCRECQNVRDNCTSCQQGYTLTNGYCRNNCPSHTFRNSANQCQSCTSTTNNGSCSECYGLAIDQCLECYSPYYLLNNVCVQSCPDGLYAVTTILRQCLPCDNTCLSCVTSPTNCTRCPWGYYLVNGTCLASCPSRYYPNTDPTNYTCLPCTLPCLQCTTQQSCTACITGYYMTPFGNCTANCSTLPASSTDLAYFLNVNTSSCEPCADNCLACTSVSRCTQCQLPSHVYQNSCVQDCPTSTYLSYDNSCQRCNETYCTACTSSTQCIECLAGVAYLLNGDCVITCPLGYIVLDGRCVINNDNQTVCTLYWLNTTNSSSCVEYCPTGYYPSNATPRQCLPCLPGCLACSSGSNCQICQLPYKLLNNSCISACPSGYVQIDSICVKCDDSCRTCSPTPTDCTSCSTIIFNGQCVTTCPDGFYADLTSASCKACAEHCSKCTSFTQCTQCKNRQYVPPSCRDNTCNSTQYKIQATGQCTDCNSNCLTCYGGSSSNCITCRSPLVLIDGQCRSACPPSYVLITANNSCIPCTLNCRVCSFVSNTTAPRCMQCYPPKILNNGICLDDCSVLANQTQAYASNGTACYPCSANCLDCIVSNSSTNCVICQAGYILYMGQCVNQCPNGFYPIQGSCSSCPQNCSSCSSQPNSCTNCTNNTYLYNGICVQPCPIDTFANNSTRNCVPCTDLQCTRCSTGANICEQCVAPYTVNSTTKTCTNCGSGYIYNSATRICDPCLDQCLTCSIVISNCTSCLAPRALIQGRCVEQCPDAYYLFVQNTTRECRRCPTNCASCQLLTNNSTQCNQCASGYYRNLVNGQCVAQCPSNTFVSNNTDCSACSTQCLTCNSTDSCTSCPNNTYLLNNRCVSPCPTGYAPLNGSCQICSVGCIRCATPTNCTNCRSDYRLNTTTRGCDEILPCTTGMYADLNGTCRNCSTGCVLCTTLQNCTQCNLTTFLLNGQCAQSCLANQYSITVSSAKYCVDCLSPCDKCISNTSCTHCIDGFFLNLNNSCVADCGDGYYGAITVINNVTYRNCTACADRKCISCTKDGCRECQNGYYLFGLIPFNMTNGSCVADCPPGYYKNNLTTPNSCQQCSVPNCDQCNSTQCLICLPPYILLVINRVSSCVSQCPTGMFPRTRNNVTACQNCMVNCRECSSAEWCRQCNEPYYLHVVSNLTTNGRTNYNTTCIPECPEQYFPLINLVSHNNTCEHCEQHCMSCINSTICIDCHTPDYVLVNDDCVPYRCVNCTTCVNQGCELCDDGFYLYNSQCYQVCPDGLYGNPETKKCQVCMENCLKCPSLNNCEQCIDGFNFTGNACVNEAFIIYGVLSNMSGFTSNITEITSAVYIGTSVGPMVFGEMTTTYFNIEFCQFILFHAKASGNNSEMNQFLSSLQSISLTMSDNSNKSAEGGKRRLLATSLADPATFLVTSAPIFAMMGGFLLVYGLIHLFHKYANSCCVSSPRLHFYATQICQFMKKRFKWIYFDFIAWISYLPFLYFSLMQLQRFSFATALEGFSCILSIIIVVVYPLYPFWIGYLLKSHYNDLVHENNQMVEMSLSPYVYKIKRPTKELVPDQPWKDYFTADNLRLAYDPLKYLRKFLFVLIVAVCHEPITSLVILIIMNIIFIGYMAVFRPKLMPYLVFDFIIEGVLLFFEIFMLVYLTNDSAKVSAMSIAAHAVGFLTANLSLIIAIILNLIAYYKIFMCIYDMVKHLREKLQEKQKGELKDSQEIEHENQDLDLPQKDHDNLTKSLKGSKIRNKRGEEATEFDQSEINNSALIKDKEIFGNHDSAINGELKRSNGGLPNLKSTKYKKKMQSQLEENSENYLFQDKQLPKKERVQDDEELTQSNPDSKVLKVQSGILKDKELYKGPSDKDIRNSIGQIPDLKTSTKKSLKSGVNVVGANIRIKQTPESDEDFMMMSGLSGQQVIAVKDGKLKEIGQSKFKRTSHLNPGDVVVSEGIPIAKSDKFRRNLNEMPKIESMGIDQQDEQDIVQEGNMRQVNRNNLKAKDNQLENGKFREANRNKKQNKQQIQDGQFVDNKRRANTNNEKNEQIQEGRFKDRRMQQRPNKPKNPKPSQELDLLEASFVEQQPRAKKQRESESQDNQDIYNISLQAKSTNKKTVPNNKIQQEAQTIEQAKFKNLKKKENSKSSAQEFDQFLEDNPQNISLKQRERQNQKQRQNKKAKSNQPSDLAELATKQRSKKQGENKQQKQGVVEGGKLIEHKSDKFRRKVEKTGEETHEQNVNYVDREGKNKAKNKRETYLDQPEEIQEGKVKDRTKKRINLEDDEQVQGVEFATDQKKKQKKKFQGELDQGELGDQYQRGKRKEQAVNRNKKGNLGINQEGKQEQYDEIIRRNKDNMFSSPDKGVLMDSLNVNDFNDSDYESRPQSKIQRPGSKGKGVLGVGDTGSAQDSDDSVSVRQQRASAIQKLRKKQGNLGIDQKSDYSGDESVSSKQGKEKKTVRRRQKSGILKIENNNDEAGMDSIQLEKKR